MGAWLIVLYSLVAYVLALATLAYAAAFAGGLGFVKNIDSGPATTTTHAIAVNLALMALFALQHSIMARRRFKHGWTRIVPPQAERSTFVLAASCAFLVLMWQWQPIADPVIWEIHSPLPVALAWTLFALGWALGLVSTFAIDHFELFGLRQAFAAAARKSIQSPAFETPLLYRVVRHPLYLGLLIGFWAVPRMSAGHLLFSIGMTAYILLGIFFEERDLIARFGSRYRDYRERVSMILPFMRGGDGKP